MKKILLTIFLLMGTFSFAQFGTISGVPLTGGCRSHPQLGIDTDSANTNLYICGDSGNWQQVTGSGGGILSINGDRTPAQTIVAGTGINVTTTGGVTTVTNTGSASLPCTVTPNSLQYDLAGAFGCATPFTFGSNTITSSSSGILDLHSASVLTGFLPPSAAGAAPVTSGLVAFNTTNHRLVSGDGSVTQTYLTPPDLNFTSPLGTITIGGTSPAQTFDVALSFRGNRNQPEFMKGVCQGCSLGLTPGVSIPGDFAATTGPTPYGIPGSSTTPGFGVPQFKNTGVIATGDTITYGPFVVPSNYTTNSNITLHFDIAEHVQTTGSVTIGCTYGDVTPPAVAQPTLFATGYDTGAVTISGTIDNTVTGTCTLTPNTAGSPTVTAGDNIWFGVFYKARTGTPTPYLTGYWSF